MAASNHDLDSSKELTHISLCAGYGGIDLGLKRAVPNLRTIAFSEIEAFAVANLVAKMEAGQLDVAPVWTNLKTFPWGKFHGLVDILSGGYPCQPFSSAGKRLGADDPRHLWPFIADGVSRMQPQIVFFENVEGHISLGLQEVIADLESRGYKATWGLFSAAECGAPHQRKRVFILAHATSVGRRKDNWFGNPKLADQDHAFWPSRPSQPQFAWEPPRVVVNASKSGLPQRRPGAIQQAGAVQEPKRPDAFEERQTEPALGGNANGPAHRLDYAELCISGDSRVDELRLLGNGVVPATAELAFRTLSHELLGTGV